MDAFPWYVPATSANLGPGFDALGLALDLFNRTTVAPSAERGVHITVLGEGAQFIPRDERNLTLRALELAFRRAGEAFPRGMRIEEENLIPASSGLGSSAAAVVAGLLAANDWLGQPFSAEDLLHMATELEGHPDNAAAALFGGLVVSAGTVWRRFSLPPWQAVVVTPDLYWPTWKARTVLPHRVNRRAAVRNIGRALLVAEALRGGDLALLQQVMQDELHEPYRLPHLPGSQEALQAARALGAAACLSGAGPSLLAFAPEKRAQAVGQAMQQAFAARQVAARVRILSTINQGARRA